MSTDNKRRVLLVDDDDSVRRAFQIILKSMGWEVVSANRAGDALRMASGGYFELAILDVAMPGMTGIEFCGHLRATCPGAVGNILVVSGNVDRITREQAFAAGAQGFLQKPVGLQELRDALDSIGCG